LPKSVQSKSTIGQSHYKTFNVQELRWQSLRRKSGFSRRLWCKINSNKEKVDANTLLALPQTAKLTSAALLMLVDEGKIKWDDKVIKYFKF
jgi:hypothetical protein